MEKNDFTVQLYKDSVELLIEMLSKESDALYEKQIYTKGIGNVEATKKALERFMIVQDLLSQFELIKLKIDTEEIKSTTPP